MFGYGLGILLLVVGAILKFAVKDQWSGVDTNMIGVILMCAGAASILLSLLFNAMATNRRSHRTVERVDTVDGTYIDERRTN